MGNMAPGTRLEATLETSAIDLTMPTFDVDVSVAAAVFARVTNTRDRLALACVSRVWRKVATSEGCCGTCDLVLDGELGKKITHDRLIGYCGDVKRLEIQDAPSSFSLKCSGFEEYAPQQGEAYRLLHRLRDQPYWAKKLASLETLKLMNCPEVHPCFELG